MNRVIHIAAVSVREHSRRKLIIVFVVITLVITLGQIAFFVNFGRGGAVAATLSSFLSAGLFARLAFVAALAVSMGNIGRPFADGETALVLARPVARWQYVLGRLASSICLVAALCLLMAIETQAVRVASGHRMSAAMWGYWGIQAYNLTILSALTTLVSVFAASPVLAGVLAFVVDRFAGGVDLLYRMGEVGGLQGGFAGVLRVAWLLTPKTLHTPLAGLAGELGGAAASPVGGAGSVENSAGLVAWSLGYLASMISLTIIAARRKEVRG